MLYYLPEVILVHIKYSLGVSFWCLGDLRTEIYVEFWVYQVFQNFFRKLYCPLFIPPSHVYALVETYDTEMITNSMIPLKPFLDPNFDVETDSEVKSR